MSISRNPEPWVATAGAKLIAAVIVALWPILFVLGAEMAALDDAASAGFAILCLAPATLFLALGSAPIRIAADPLPVATKLLAAAPRRQRRALKLRRAPRIVGSAEQLAAVQRPRRAQRPARIIASPATPPKLVLVARSQAEIRNSQSKTMRRAPRIIHPDVAIKRAS